MICKNRVDIKYRYWSLGKEKARNNPWVVPESTKELCWSDMTGIFLLPQDDKELLNRIKKFTLKEFGMSFKNFKGHLYRDFVLKGKTPDWELPRYTKARIWWPQFIEWKQSEEAQIQSEKNKLNSAKNTAPHRLGTGGYIGKRKQFEQYEKDLLDKGITPVTIDWTDRAKMYLFGRGAKLAADGSLITITAESRRVADRLVEIHQQVKEGKFVPVREHDELTVATGRPEKGGRTRGVGLFSWKEAFTQYIELYRKRRGRPSPQEHEEFRAMLREDMRDVMPEVLAEHMQQIQDGGAQLLDDIHMQPLPQSTEHVRSSCASADAAQDDTGHFPVDDITTRRPCKLMHPMSNILIKVGAGVAVPDDPFLAMFPCPVGYARVEVEQVGRKFKNLPLEIPPEEGITTLRKALHYMIAWPKRHISFDPDDSDESSSDGSGPKRSNNNPLPPPREPTPPPREPTPPPREPTPPRESTTPPKAPLRKKQRTSAKTSIDLHSQPPKEQISSKKVGAKRQKSSATVLDTDDPVALAAHVAAEVRRQLAPRVPEPKEPIPKDAVEHFVTMMKSVAPSPVSDYERIVSKPSIQRQARHLLDQSKAKSEGFQVLTEQQRLEKEFLDEIGVANINELENLPEAPLRCAWKFGKPMLFQSQVTNLTNKLHWLHNWYMQESSRGRKSILCKLPADVFHHEFLGFFEIEFRELYQFYHSDMLETGFVQLFIL